MQRSNSERGHFPLQWETKQVLQQKPNVVLLANYVLVTSDYAFCPFRAIRYDRSLHKSKVQGIDFRFRGAICQERCEIELKSQLINNRNHIGLWAFDLCKSPWPWMTLNGQNTYALQSPLTKKWSARRRNVQLTLVPLICLFFAYF